MPAPDPTLLGALYAVLGVLALLVLLVVGAALALWGWLRAFAGGSMRWGKDGVNAELRRSES